HVRKHVTEQHDARDRHHVLLADRRSIELERPPRPPPRRPVHERRRRATEILLRRHHQFRTLPRAGLTSGNCPYELRIGWFARPDHVRVFTMSLLGSERSLGSLSPPSAARRWRFPRRGVFAWLRALAALAVSAKCGS